MVVGHYDHIPKVGTGFLRRMSRFLLDEPENQPPPWSQTITGSLAVFWLEALAVHM
jgi:hypothetical protein